ncbi:MAG TPA: alpha/beta hydrolase [Phnomibacter sp.]|nr:alpha/beta hydrolase [Phnomibacter sp.]
MLFQAGKKPWFTILIVLVVAFHQKLLAQPAGIPRDTSYNVAATHRKIAKAFPYAVPAKDSMPANVVAARNKVYTTLKATRFGDRDLHLDIFRPNNTQVLPALVMIHGGGWRSGTKEMQVPMAQMLAAKGIVALPVEYQLSLEAGYPAALHNIKSAIRWLRAHAQEYHIDTARIAISGCSAGGQLASLTGLTNYVSAMEGDHGNAGFSSAVNAIIDIDGVIDFMAPASLSTERKPNSADVEWLGGMFSEKPLIWKEASPIFSANEKRIVPMMFLNSGFPRFHAGQDELIGMLKQWNSYYEVHQFPVEVHPFWLFHPWVDEVVDHVAAFIQKVPTVQKK